MKINEELIRANKALVGTRIPLEEPSMIVFSMR